MDWLKDLLYFLFIPGLVLCVALLLYRGDRQGYKIIKETNTLGESRYEVWFEYYSIHGTYGWRHEETFNTEEQADQFVARQFKTREVIREGKLR